MDEKTFRDIITDNASALTAYAHSRCGDAHLAQDVVQEVFLKFLDDFQNVKNPKAWLYKSCRNKLIDAYRKNKDANLGGSDVLEFLPDIKEIPPEKMERAELYESLFDAIKLLKTDEAEIINLRYFGELSYMEIAKVLEINPINAGVKLKRATDSLRKIMEGGDTPRQGAKL